MFHLKFIKTSHFEASFSGYSALRLTFKKNSGGGPPGGPSGLVCLTNFALLDGRGNRMDWNTIGYKVTDTGHLSVDHPGKNILRPVERYPYCSEYGSFSNSGVPTSGPEVVTIELTNNVTFSQFELACPHGHLLQAYCPIDWTLEGQVEKGNWQVLYQTKGGHNLRFKSNEPVVFNVGDGI